MEETLLEVRNYVLVCIQTGGVVSGCGLILFILFLDKSATSKQPLKPPAPAPPTAGPEPHPQNVFEQILKTPSLFHDAASHITQPKRYSDAVGKRSTVSSSSTNEIGGGSSGSGKVSYSGVMSAPPSSGGVVSGSGSKINLAPGSRPTSGNSDSGKVIHT